MISSEKLSGKEYFINVFGQYFKEVLMISPDLPDYRFRELADEWLTIKDNIPKFELAKNYKLIIKNLPRNNAHIIYKEEITLQPSKFSSFIHEWGHLLDDAYSIEGVFLNKQKEFSEIKKIIKKDIIDYIKRNKKNVGKGYMTLLFDSEEIFARSFEYYFWKKGFDTSYNRSDKVARKVSIDLGYRLRNNTVDKIVNYFDTIFNN